MPKSILESVIQAMKAMFMIGLLLLLQMGLRARLSYHPEFKDQMHDNREDIQVEFDCNRIQGEIDCFNNGVSGQVVLLEDMRTLNCINADQVNCSSTSNDQSPCSNHDVSARDDIFRNLVPLEGTSFTAEEISPHTGRDLNQVHMDKISDFDPIRQHRHFCRWIASTGSRAPGWQQTLFAVLHGKDFPHSSSTCSSSSASLIKVDDPIASVRKLFMSPTAKKNEDHPLIKPE